LMESFSFSKSSISMKWTNMGGGYKPFYITPPA